MSSCRRRGNVRHQLGRNAELLVLLLAYVAGAIVHGDAHPRAVGQVRTPAVPEAAHPDEHAALRHFGGDGVVVLQRVGGVVPQMAAGMRRVAPFSSVKSVIAHMVLQMIGMWGRVSGITWSSAWIGCARSPGPMAIEDSEEIRAPGSRTPSTTGSTSGWTGIFSKVGPWTKRL